MKAITNLKYNKELVSLPSPTSIDGRNVQRLGDRSSICVRVN